MLKKIREHGNGTPYNVLHKHGYCSEPHDIILLNLYGITLKAVTSSHMHHISINPYGITFYEGGSLMVNDSPIKEAEKSCYKIWKDDSVEKDAEYKIGSAIDVIDDVLESFEHLEKTKQNIGLNELYRKQNIPI